MPDNSNKVLIYLIAGVCGCCVLSVIACVVAYKASDSAKKWFDRLFGWNDDSTSAPPTTTTTTTTDNSGSNNNNSGGSAGTKPDDNNKTKPDDKSNTDPNACPEWVCPEGYVDQKVNDDKKQCKNESLTHSLANHIILGQNGENIEDLIKQAGYWNRICKKTNPSVCPDTDEKCKADLKPDRPLGKSLCPDGFVLNAQESDESKKCYHKQIDKHSPMMRIGLFGASLVVGKSGSRRRTRKASPGSRSQRAAGGRKSRAARQSKKKKKRSKSGRARKRELFADWQGWLL